MTYKDYLVLLRRGATIAIEVLIEIGLCDKVIIIKNDKAIKYLINYEIEKTLEEVGVE